MVHRVVIIGAGFVGVMAAKNIKHLLGKNGDVTLMDDKNFFLFAPRLVDGLAEPCEGISRYTAPLAPLAAKHHITFLKGRATRIDRIQQTITYTTGRTSTQLPYDVLVLCQGARTTYYDIPGAQEHTYPLKTADDLTRICKSLQGILLKAQRAATEEEQRKLLSFAVVGGGPSGVESIFALRQHVEDVCYAQKTNLLHLATFTLIQGAPQILPGFPLTIVHGVMKECAKRQIHVMTGAQVTKMTQDAIETTQHPPVSAQFVLWTAGVSANTIPTTPEIFIEKNGSIAVDRFLRVNDRLFAAGDAAVYREQNVVIPKNAQTAMQMAETVAKNVVRTLFHQPLVPFHYSSKGNVITTGKTGFIDLQVFSFKSRLAPLLRDLFYRLRQHQILK